ncbi:MAG: iron-containing alcohol dehydrogenase, partial [Spirochaetes bacterium]|nr:iron-containing alcohol dehydrogenase [Spirochaetota bacterium]
MISLKSIEFSLPTKIIFGTEVVDRIGEIAKEYSDKVFLISDGKIMRKNGILGKVENLLELSSVEYILYENVDNESAHLVVDEIATLVRQSRVKYIIAVGGSSVINTAKAAAYLGKNKGKIAEFLNGGIGIDESIPVIAIPTIPGIQQQINDEFVLNDTNDNIKKIYRNPSLFPFLSIIDPKLTA